MSPVQLSDPTQREIRDFTSWLNALVSGFEWRGLYVEGHDEHCARYRALQGRVVARRDYSAEVEALVAFWDEATP